MSIHHPILSVKNFSTKMRGGVVNKYPKFLNKVADVCRDKTVEDFERMQINSKPKPRARKKFKVGGKYLCTFSNNVNTEMSFLGKKCSLMLKYFWFGN